MEVTKKIYLPFIEVFLRKDENGKYPKHLSDLITTSNKEINETFMEVVPQELSEIGAMILISRGDLDLALKTDYFSDVKNVDFDNPATRFFKRYRKLIDKIVVSPQVRSVKSRQGYIDIVIEEKILSIEIITNMFLS